MSAARRSGRARRSAVLGGIVSIFLGSAGAAVLATVPAQAAVRPLTATPAQLAYTALTPARIADTRCGASPAPSFCASELLPTSNSALTTLPAGGSVNVAMPATVPSNAAAVVLNVAAVDQTGSGFLTVWPAGQTRSTTANENFAPSQSAFGVSNLVTVALGSAGGAPAISVYDGPSNGGSVDVTVDLQGYYAPPVGNAGGFTPETPTRIADSRCTAGSTPSFCSSEGLPSQNSGVVTLGPGATDTLTVAGVGGVPSSGVAAAIMNVAITDATSPSFLSMYPGASRPQVANLNWTGGETLSNKVLVDLGPTGQVTLYNNSGTVDVVVDVDGWFSSAASTTAGDLFTPMSPARLADTRCGAAPAPSFCGTEGLPSANAALASLTGGNAASVAIASIDGVPSGAVGAVLNVTDVQPQTGNYLTVYPAGSAVPVASDVNYVPANPYNVVPNASYADLGSGASAVANGPADAGLTDVVVDLFGYFSPGSSSPLASVQSAASSLPADGVSTDTITTTLTALGVPVPGIPVSLSGLPSVPGACGSFVPSSGVTDAAGQFVSTYTSSTTAGACTVTSTLDGLTPSTVLTQTGGTPTAGLQSTLSSLTADGVSTTTLTTTIAALGVPLPGIPVSLSGVPSVPGACGSFVPSSGLTDLAGQFVSTYTASTTAGTCTVTSTLDGLTPSTVLTQTVGSATAGLQSAQSSLPADGLSTTTLTTTLSALGVPLPGVPVLLSGVPSVPGACGSFVPSSGLTNLAGQFTSTYTSSATAGTCTVTAALDGLLPSLPITQTVAGGGGGGGGGSTTSVAVAASPTSINVGLLDLLGGSTTVTATVTNGGSPVAGDSVAFHASCGSVSPSPVSTNSSGQASTTFSVPAGLSLGETCTVTATEANSSQQGSTQITVLL